MLCELHLMIAERTLGEPENRMKLAGYLNEGIWSATSSRKYMNKANKRVTAKRVPAKRVPGLELNTPSLSSQPPLSHSSSTLSSTNNQSVLILNSVAPVPPTDLTASEKIDTDELKDVTN